MSRIDPPWNGPERESLLTWLQYHRDTLAAKCADLTPVQLCERSVPPSSMSLAGLVRHMAEVERNWFRRLVAGEGDATAGPIYYDPADNPDGDFDDAHPDTVVRDLEVWREEMARADEIIAAIDDVDRRVIRWGGTPTSRCAGCSLT